MMEPLNTQVSSLYGVNMGEYGEAGVSSMMALMTAHQLHGDGESIIRRRVPLHSLFNGHAAQSLASASAVLAPLPMFEPNKLQRQSQAVMEQQFSTKVPLVKIEGGCNNLPNRFGLHREQAVNCFAESSSMQLVNQAVDSLASQAPEAHSPHFSSNSRTPTTTASDEDEADAMKAKILAHPGYLCLLEAYINCQKVGAPPEVVARLDAAGKEHDYRLNQRTTSIGKDPELDRFMEAYREMLNTYQEELTKPLNEALSFFKKIETQFNSLTNGSISISSSAEGDEKTEGGGISEEENCSTGEMEYEEVVQHHSEDRELKDRLLRKYGGCLSSLKQEFMKKKKKGKLPKEARQKLLDWWNVHYKWPYPSEIEKVALAECTGLDQKQINNWFINQRKRHWKPSDDTPFVVMESHPPHTAAFFVERHLMTEGSAFHLDC